MPSTEYALIYSLHVQSVIGHAACVVQQKAKVLNSGGTFTEGDNKRGCLLLEL